MILIFPHLKTEDTLAIWHLEFQTTLSLFVVISSVLLSRHRNAEWDMEGERA